MTLNEYRSKGTIYFVKVKRGDMQPVKNCVSSLPERGSDQVYNCLPVIFNIIST